MNFKKDSLYIVLGGGGFLGNNVCNYLAAIGKDFLNVDFIPNNSEKMWPKQSRSIYDPHLIDILKSEARTKYLINLAAPSTHISKVNQHEDQLKLTQFKLADEDLALSKFVERILNCGVESYVFASSIDVYGDKLRSNQRIDESSDLIPNTTYGETKRQLEVLYTRLAQENGINFHILRLGHIYGPYEHLYYKRLVPNICLGLSSKVEINITVPSGFKRQYIYALDIASVIVAILDRNESSTNNFVGTQVDKDLISETLFAFSGKYPQIHTSAGVDDYVALIGSGSNFVNSFQRTTFFDGIKECLASIGEAQRLKLQSRVSR